MTDAIIHVKTKLKGSMFHGSTGDLNYWYSDGLTVKSEKYRSLLFYRLYIKIYKKLVCTLLRVSFWYNHTR